MPLIMKLNILTKAHCSWEFLEHREHQNFLIENKFERQKDTELSFLNGNFLALLFIFLNQF